MAPSKPLRQLASEKLHGEGANPSQLGDPVSLKAESASSSPTDQDRGASKTDNNSSSSSSSSNSSTRTAPSSSGGSHEEKQLKEGKKSLKGMMTEQIAAAEKGGANRTMLGDPTSLKAETSARDPVDHDNGPSESPQTKRDGSKL